MIEKKEKKKKHVIPNMDYFNEPLDNRPYEFIQIQERELHKHKMLSSSCTLKGCQVCKVLPTTQGGRQQKHWV